MICLLLACATLVNSPDGRIRPEQLVPPPTTTLEARRAEEQFLDGIIRLYILSEPEPEERHSDMARWEVLLTDPASSCDSLVVVVHLRRMAGELLLADDTPGPERLRRIKRAMRVAESARARAAAQWEAVVVPEGGTSWATLDVPGLSRLYPGANGHYFIPDDAIEDREIYEMAVADMLQRRSLQDQKDLLARSLELIDSRLRLLFSQIDRRIEPSLQPEYRGMLAAGALRSLVEIPRAGLNPTSEAQTEDSDYAAARSVLKELADHSYHKGDETRLGYAENLYISMMLDTINTAYMSVPSRRDAAETQRREKFLLASPSVAPPDTMASSLVGKSFYFDNAIAQFHTDQRYFDLLAACLCIAYANARNEFLAIVAPSVEEMGIWPIPAPRGYMPSVDPEDVVEEDLREEYAERYYAFIRMQGLLSDKQRAESRLKRTTKSFQTIAERIQSAANDQVTERFLEILTKHAGEESIQELLPAKFEDRE